MQAVALWSPAAAWVLWFLAGPIQALVTRRFRTIGVFGLPRREPNP